MTKEIYLTRGKVAIVDDEDYERLKQYHWRALVTPHSTYANRSVLHGRRRRRGEKSCVLMHREIMNCQPGEEVDHKDGNGLNNQKSNLRKCTSSQNKANRRREKDNRSGYKGVCWHSLSGKWMARVGVNNKSVYLGLYTTAEEAAKARDKAALEHFGEFARLNFPH